MKSQYRLKSGENSAFFPCKKTGIINTSKVLEIQKTRSI